MPNYCWNWVEFEGNKTTLEKLNKDIQDGFKEADGYLVKLANYLLGESYTDESVPSLYDAYGTKWWDIDRNDLDGDLLVVGGTSAWSPPSELIRKITAKYKVKAVIEFEECGNDFGGQETYIDGEVVEEILMPYDEWIYFNERDYALERMVGNIEDSPLDYFEDLESLESELNYMRSEDRELIKQIYLEIITKNKLL